MSSLLTPAPTAAETKAWKKLARAMTVSASGVALSGLASIAATKILAVTLGPTAVASLQTLQQVRQTAVIAATSNGQTALVQGASSLDRVDRARYLRTAVCIFLVGTVLVILGFWAAPGLVLERTGLTTFPRSTLLWLLIAALLTSAYVFLTALLNSLGKVETLAGLQVAGPAALALLAYPVARTGGVSGIAAMVAVSAAVSAVAALAAVMRQRVLLGAWFSGTSQWFSGPAAKHFLSISGVMLVTGFLASAAVLVVRGNIVHSQGLQRAGLFDAAWSISMNQVTLVLASVQTYYLPALSRASTPEEKTREISRVLIAATLVSAPVIAALELFQPRVLELFYSPVFHGAHQYLRWTLLGDYLKVASWILSVPMLAAADMKLFLASDLAATATFVGAAFLATFWREAAESAAMAFFFMYAVHLTISFLYVRFRQRSRLGYRSIALWMAGLALVATAASLSWSEARYR